MKRTQWSSQDLLDQVPTDFGTSEIFQNPEQKYLKFFSDQTNILEQANFFVDESAKFDWMGAAYFFYSSNAEINLYQKVQLLILVVLPRPVE